MVGGAASKTGKVKVKDQIIAVAQGKGEMVDIVDMDLRDVVKLIEGLEEQRFVLCFVVMGKTLLFPL